MLSSFMRTRTLTCLCFAILLRLNFTILDDRNESTATPANDSNRRRHGNRHRGNRTKEEFAVCGRSVDNMVRVLRHMRLGCQVRTRRGCIRKEKEEETEIETYGDKQRQRQRSERDSSEHGCMKSNMKGSGRERAIEYELLIVWVNPLKQEL
jgi:predicted secreted Zn-dependent protease